LARNNNVDANFLICNVYGEDWSKKAPNTDAVTSATSAINPQDVAERVVKNVLIAVSDTTATEKK